MIKTRPLPHPHPLPHSAVYVITGDPLLSITIVIPYDQPSHIIPLRLVSKDVQAIG